MSMANVARNLASVVLLLLVLPLITGIGVELNEQPDGPHFFAATVLTLAAQLAVICAGFVASPKEKKVGVPRTIAYIYLLAQSFGLLSLFGIVAYLKFKGAESDPEDTKALIWMLVGSSSGFAFVLLLTKRWRLQLRERLLALRPWF